jgi:hypothetical protein
MNEEFYQRIELYHQELVQRLFGPDSISAVPVEENQGYPCLLNAIPQGNNILGFGYGIKYVAGQRIDGDLVVRVYVRSKLPPSALSPQEMIPSEINGIGTDVVVSGDIRAFARPTECGVSVGRSNTGQGTLGCLVKKNDGTPGKFILSNNHVLANLNNAIPGDNIFQPGGNGSGASLPITQLIAKLSDFEPLNFQGGANFIDAAIAEVINPRDVLPDIKLIGRVTNPPIDPVEGQFVEKTGSTTFRTDGIVDDIVGAIPVAYGNVTINLSRQIRIVKRFVDQFSNPGDSGSLIVETLSNRPVALLNAGDGIPNRNIPNTQTFASPIAPILQRFKIEII